MLFIKLKNGLFSTNIEINLGRMLSHTGIHLDRKQKETQIDLIWTWKVNIFRSCLKQGIRKIG